MPASPRQQASDGQRMDLDDDRYGGLADARITIDEA